MTIEPPDSYTPESSDPYKRSDPYQPADPYQPEVTESSDPEPVDSYQSDQPDSFEPASSDPYEAEETDSDDLAEYEEAIDDDATDMDYGDHEDDTSDFSTGEGMVALGGAIIAAVYVLELFLKDYGVHTTGLVIAIVVIGLPRLDRAFVEKVAPLPVLMRLGGYLLGVAGVIQILSDLSGGNLDPFVAAIAAIATYAGYTVAFLGARSINS